MIQSNLVDVRDSPIHGKGLFAARRIRKGEVIGQIVGRLTTDDGPYVLWINESLGVEVHNDLRYINHSEAPNAAYFDDGEVAAIRAIEPGEEITHDYGQPEFDEDDASASPTIHVLPVNSAPSSSPSGVS
ncbi:MAG: SET domain-containing protein-lysine N-methyltransferase [Planctomycetota bacterium]